MKWEHGKGFRITGYVVRKFVAPSGKCCFLTIETPGEKGKPDKTEMVGFKDMVVEMGSVGEGQVVQVTGTIGTKLLQNRARQDVMVDDRKVWALQLIVRTIKVEGAESVGPLTQPAAGATASARQANAAPATLDWEAEDKANDVDW